jgi:hypothetical protein
LLNAKHINDQEIGEKMNQQVLQEIEYSLLESRLGVLRDKGVNSNTRHLSDAFFKVVLLCARGSLCRE